MWRPRRPIVRISSNVPILGHTQPRLPGARCWCHCRMGWCPHRPGLCCSSLCSTWSCHHYDGSYQRTWTGFLAAFRIRNMSLGKYFDGCIACENGILVLALRLCRAEVIENAEFGKSFFDANHEVWRRRRTHLYFDLTFVAHHLRPQD